MSMHLFSSGLTGPGSQESRPAVVWICRDSCGTQLFVRAQMFFFVCLFVCLFVLLGMV